MEEEGALEDPEDYDDAERASRHVKLLLNKLRAGVTLDDQLDAFMKLQRSLSGAMGGDEQERGDSAQTRRLFQDAGTLYGWRNVQEMTVKLIDEVNALEKRRRHVGAIEPRRQKNMCSVTPEPDAQEESAIETRIRAALRKSLLGTNGEPRTARGLKRAVLRQWANVVEEDQEQGRGPSEQEPDEETVRMILDLDFSEVESNIDGFSVALEKDVKNALGIDGEGIRVCSVEAGSVIAMLALLPVSDGRSAMVSPFEYVLPVFPVLHCWRRRQLTRFPRVAGAGRFSQGASSGSCKHPALGSVHELGTKSDARYKT
jgi:hypothetical protein